MDAVLKYIFAGVVFFVGLLYATFRIVQAYLVVAARSVRRFLLRVL